MTKTNAPRQARLPLVGGDELKLIVRRVISGGQTGVDRGALDAVIALGIEHGGWCPRGRLAEDGQVPSRFQLNECDSIGYHVRTEKNVLDSDATLILFRQELSGGTALTVRFAKQHARPCKLVDLSQSPNVADVRDWLAKNRVEVLNVAGPRESSTPGIAAQAEEFVKQLLSPVESN